MEPTHPPMMESRKFKALCMALVTYLLPVAMVFVLVLTHHATKDDLITLAKWMGAAMSPIFAAYIGGVALEGWAEKRTTGPTAIATTAPVVAPPATT